MAPHPAGSSTVTHLNARTSTGGLMVEQKNVHQSPIEKTSIHSWSSGVETPDHGDENSSLYNSYNVSAQLKTCSSQASTSMAHQLSSPTSQQASHCVDHPPPFASSSFQHSKNHMTTVLNSITTSNTSPQTSSQSNLPTLDKDYYGCYCLKFIVKGTCNATNGNNNSGTTSNQQNGDSSNHIDDRESESQQQTSNVGHTSTMTSSTTEDEVLADFGQFGEVVDVRGPGLFSALKGHHVYVRFVEKSDAESALTHLKQKYVQLSPASISDVLPDNYGLYTISFYNKTGIPSAEVRREFCQYGEVKNMTGSLDVKGGRVFVSYKEKVSAVQALQAFFFRKDRYPNMKFALPRCEKDYFGCYCLKFYNKSGDVTEKKVLEDFGRFGSVVDVRGPGLFDVTGDDVYVRYKEKSSAEQALIELVGRYDSLCLAPPSDIQADKFGYFTITFVNDRCLSKSDVWYIFSKFGTVACVNGTFDCKKGRVFVSYKDKQGALNALETMLITKEYHLQVSKNSTVRKSDYSVAGGNANVKFTDLPPPPVLQQIAPPPPPTTHAIDEGTSSSSLTSQLHFAPYNAVTSSGDHNNHSVSYHMSETSIGGPGVDMDVVDDVLAGKGRYPHLSAPVPLYSQPPPPCFVRNMAPPPTQPTASLDSPNVSVHSDRTFISANSQLNNSSVMGQQQSGSVVEKDVFGLYCLSFLNESGEINEKKVRSDFGKFGEVVSVRGALAPPNSTSSPSKLNTSVPVGHVFVRFRKQEAAENCLNCLNSFPLEEMSQIFGKYLYLSPATPRDIERDNELGGYTISFLNLTNKSLGEISCEFSRFGVISKIVQRNGADDCELVLISFLEKKSALHALLTHVESVKDYPCLDIGKGSTVLLSPSHHHQSSTRILPRHVSSRTTMTGILSPNSPPDFSLNGLETSFDSHEYNMQEGSYSCEEIVNGEPSPSSLLEKRSVLGLKNILLTDGVEPSNASQSTVTTVVSENSPSPSKSVNNSFHMESLLSTVSLSFNGSSSAADLAPGGGKSGSSAIFSPSSDHTIDQQHVSQVDIKGGSTNPPVSTDIVDELLKPLQSYFQIYRTGNFPTTVPPSDLTIPAVTSNSSTSSLLRSFDESLRRNESNSSSFIIGSNPLKGSERNNGTAGSNSALLFGGGGNGSSPGGEHLHVGSPSGRYCDLPSFNGGLSGGARASGDLDFCGTNKQRAHHRYSESSVVENGFVSETIESGGKHLKEPSLVVLLGKDKNENNIFISDELRWDGKTAPVEILKESTSTAAAKKGGGANKSSRRGGATQSSTSAQPNNQSSRKNSFWQQQHTTTASSTVGTVYSQACSNGVNKERGGSKKGQATTQGQGNVKGQGHGRSSLNHWASNNKGGGNKGGGMESKKKGSTLNGLSDTVKVGVQSKKNNNSEEKGRCHETTAIVPVEESEEVRVARIEKEMSAMNDYTFEVDHKGSYSFVAFISLKSFMVATSTSSSIVLDERKMKSEWVKELNISDITSMLTFKVISLESISCNLAVVVSTSTSSNAITLWSAYVKCGSNSFRQKYVQFHPLTCEEWNIVSASNSSIPTETHDLTDSCMFYTLEFMNCGLLSMREIDTEFSKVGQVERVVVGVDKNKRHIKCSEFVTNTVTIVSTLNGHKMSSVSFGTLKEVRDALEKFSHSKLFSHVDLSPECLKYHISNAN